MRELLRWHVQITSPAGTSTHSRHLTEAAAELAAQREAARTIRVVRVHLHQARLLSLPHELEN